MKPLVGVMPLWDEKKDSIWMLPGYLDGLKQAGASTIIFPFTDDAEELNRLIGLCDGLLFTGGHDVSPSLYGEAPLGDLVLSERKRDSMEKVALDIALSQDKPILGICRGLQFINVYFGGTLYQDLPTQFPQAINHRQSAPYDNPCHEVVLAKDSPLQRSLGLENVRVNTCHHQGIKRLAEPLIPMAKSSDGLVEAFYHPNHSFLWAVQWHPEFMFVSDDNSRKIFKAFVDSMTTKK